MRPRPLAGMTLLLTRPEGRNAESRRALEDLGARVFEEPLTRTSPLPDEEYASFDKALGAIGSYDWVLFTSAEGVRYSLARASETAGRLAVLPDFIPAGVRVAAIGPATAEAVHSAGRKPDLVPSDYRAEGLVEALAEAAGGLRGQRLLLLRAREGRDVIPRDVEAMGGEVDVVPVYRTEGVPDGAARATARLAAGGIDLVVMTSGAAVDELASAMACRPDLKATTRIAAIGPVTAAKARRQGFDVVVEPPRATAASLVLALVSLSGKRERNDRSQEHDEKET